MYRARTIIAATMIALFLVAPTIIQVTAQGPGSGNQNPPQQRRENGAVFLNTDVITVMANEELPMFHFWYTGDENGTTAKFMASYVTLIEFEDENDDGAFQSDEILRHAPLAGYEWTVQTGSVSDGDVTSEVWVKYTKGGTRTGGPLQALPISSHQGPGAMDDFEDVTIQIWAHLYLDDYEGVVTDDHGVHTNYTVVGGAELKMDIEIGNFPFSSNNTSVALEAMLREDQATGPQYQNRYRFETRERNRNVTANSGMNWTAPDGNETRFQNRSDTATERIDFVDTETSSPTGFFSWLDTAVITHPGGDTEAVEVTASYVPTGMGLSVYLAYPNFGEGSILHDPSIGLLSDVSSTLILGIDNTVLLIIGGIILVGIVVVVLRRR